jgi:hypothetical protein
MPEVEWLCRRVAIPGPYLTLCLSQAECDAAFDHLKATRKVWTLTKQGATTHHLESPEGEATCVVCLSGWEGVPPLEVVALLVHEAVHVWQWHCARIGETDPGSEQEAYGIQHISLSLCSEFERRMRSK